MDGVIGDRKKVKDVYLFYTKQTRGQSASSLFNFSTQIFPFKVLVLNGFPAAKIQIMTF